MFSISNIILQRKPWKYCL